MTERELREKCVALTSVGDAVAALVLKLLDEVEGLRKANELLNKGMGVVCEDRDRLKHLLRQTQPAG